MTTDAVIGDIPVTPVPEPATFLYSAPRSRRSPSTGGSAASG